VVLSFRNEAAVIPELLRRTTAALAALDYELIFVNDASVDDSLGLLAAEARANPRVKVITMSRPFGPAECAVAGLAHAGGDAVVLMDADLQDPPELIPTMVQRWREGADVVYAVRTRRHGESSLKMLLVGAAYRIIRRSANIDLPVDTGDFRLLSRRAVQELLKLPEQTPYLRGLTAWIGFTQVPVFYERQPRFAGRAHFSFFAANPWRTFLSGLTSFSWPAAIVLLPIGLVLSVMALAALLAIVIVPSWRASASVALLLGLGLAMLVALQLAAIGLIAVYVGRIYDDVRGRPRYIVADTIGIDKES
jgi:dolichol-phosphate mannosyltransferase